MMSKLYNNKKKLYNSSKQLLSTKFKKSDNNNINNTDQNKIIKEIIIEEIIIDFTNINYYLNRPILEKRNIKIINRKITDNEFVIPKFGEYNNMINNNYNVNQLRSICKTNNIKISGNKDELNKRCYNFLYFSFYIIKLQSFARLYFINNYIKLHGKGFRQKSICVNDTDFGTLDNLVDIPYSQFFSFTDDTDHTYGFDKQSIYNLYFKKKKVNNLENPYTTKIIDKNVYYDIIKFIKYSKLLNIDININFNKDDNLDETKELEMKVLNLFQDMDSLGNYTNMSWLNNLTKYDLIKFFRELLDIWNYRANLSQETKREICPPSGNPFNIVNVNTSNLSAYNYLIIKKMIVDIINEFINKGIDRESRILGSFYVLSCLTLVNPAAAEAMPWLFESVNYN